MNKRGVVETVIPIILATCITVGFIQTARNGVLKKNGKKIWCKMQNKGNNYCDLINDIK